ncbi:MAG: TMEM165/GDT1 family protein [Deltaproteobacteria bacterium]|nr:TMEM165/GDT1 family protein [Deltaproteobacteria bacterium]
MDLKLIITVFATVFLAEVADKTQIATFLYASDSGNSRLAVWIGAVAALTLTSTIAVFAGYYLSHQINAKIMTRIAGTTFIIVGVWTLLRG